MFGIGKIYNFLVLTLKNYIFFSFDTKKLSHIYYKYNNSSEESGISISNSTHISSLSIIKV